MIIIRKNNVDLGYVGEIESIDEKFINSFITNKSIPVIAPIGIGQDGQFII